MQRLPAPTVKAAIVRPTDAQRPVALVGICHPIRLTPPGILQHERLAAVAQPARPTADSRLGLGIFFGEHNRISRDHQQAVCRENYVRKLKLHPARQPPAFEIDRTRVAIEQLDVLLPIVLRGRVIHDLVDDDVGKIGIHSHLPRAPGKRVAAEVADLMTRRPSHRDRAFRLRGKVKPIRTGSFAADGLSGRLAKQQIGSAHPGHRF